MASRASSPLRGPRLLASLCALVLTLPGCVTAQLWGLPVMAPVGKRRIERVELVEERVTEGAATLRFAPDERRPELLVDGEGVSMWLDSGTPRGAGADVALRMLRGDGPTRGVEVSLEAEVDLVGGERVASTAELIVRGALDPGALGVVVAPASIGPEALAVLSTPRRNAFAFASDPWLFLPVVHRRCAQELLSRDLAPVVGGAGPVEFESFVFVGDDGRPRYEPRRPWRVPPAARREDLTLSERLEVLAEEVLIVRARRGGRDVYVQLRPDRFWLWAQTECDGDDVVHRSRWNLLGQPSAAASGRAVAATPSASFRRVERIYRGVAPARGLGERIALTPVAVAVDILLLPIYWLVFSTEDDEPAPPPRRIR